MKTAMPANRTGLEANPDLVPGMLEVTALTVPSSTSDEPSLDDLRREVIAERAAIGSRPAARSAAQALLLDKLGDRHAFERAGTRLYETMLLKVASGGSFPGGPEEEDLGRIRDQEHAHMVLVAEAIRAQGGDPTAITPCANLSLVAGSGLVAILTDPRTSVGECLQALLIAELTDNDAWDTLITVAAGAGQDDLAESLRAARAEEAEHLERVRAWVAAYAEHELAGPPRSGRGAPRNGHRLQ